MIIALVVCIVLVVLIALMFFYLWRAESGRRLEVEDDLVIARLRGDVLHEQVPFPYGEQLP